jgi:predicted nuclease with TOPRIM domain
MLVGIIEIIIKDLLEVKALIEKLVTENARLQGIENAAIKQSEEVQKSWLSPAEAHGLREEIKKLNGENSRLIVDIHFKSAEIAALKLHIKEIEEDFGV